MPSQELPFSSPRVKRRCDDLVCEERIKKESEVRDVDAADVCDKIIGATYALVSAHQTTHAKEPYRAFPISKIYDM